MKRLLTLALIAIMAIGLAACGGNDNSSNNNSSNNNNTPTGQNSTDSANSNTNEQPASKSTVYPLTVKDATGQEMTFDKAPERIVSVSPSETEILFALGLGERIVGVSDFDNYPEEATAKPKMGGIITPNEEAMIAAEADLVVTGISMGDDVATKLRGLGLQLYKTNPRTLDDVYETILQIGVITDSQERAEEIVAGMREDARKVADAVATLKDKKKVFIEFAPGWTVGKGEFMDELITLAGATNIASAIEGWSPINEEMIIQESPDVILYSADMVDFETGKPLEELIMNRSGWDQIKAIKDGQVKGLNEDILSRTGPRVTQGLLDIAEAVYPGLVQQ